MAWATLKVTNPWIVQDQGSKSTSIGSTIIVSTRVQIPFFVSTMLICRQKELNMIERSACSYSRPMWKLTFHAMATKVSQIASWVPIRLLLWAQRKKWIPIGLMRCVHTHQWILVIEKWDSSSCVQNSVKKIGNPICSIVWHLLSPCHNYWYNQMGGMCEIYKHLISSEFLFFFFFFGCSLFWQNCEHENKKDISYPKFCVIIILFCQMF